MTCAAGTCDQRNYTPVIRLNQASHATDVTSVTYLLQFPYGGGSRGGEIAALVALMAPITAVTAISRASGRPSWLQKTPVTPSGHIPPGPEPMSPTRRPLRP
jgi:hypothetical protein